MPEPTPAPTPEPALPVGAEGEPFFGEWHGMSMEMDGETFSFDDFDMVMDLTLNEDGTAALFDGEETDLTSWKVEDGVAIIDTMRGSIQPDGSLCLEEDGSKLYFTRSEAASGAEAVTTPEPEVTKPETIEPETAVPASDDMAAYIGTWHACYLVTGRNDRRPPQRVQSGHCAGVERRRHRQPDLPGARKRTSGIRMRRAALCSLATAATRRICR